MSQPFDPYKKWFGIPKEERPVNHYLLLGLKPFESNLEVIRTAGEKRVEFLQDVSGGRHVESAQKCLNEVARAVLCLTNPEKKLVYDRQLKTDQVSPAPKDSAGGVSRSQSVSGRAETVAKTAPGRSADQTETVDAQKVAGSKNGLLIKIAASAVGVIVVGYLLSVLLSGGKEEAAAQAQKTGAEKRYDEDWKYPGSNKESKKETARNAEIKQLDIPTPVPANLSFEDLGVSKGERVAFEAVVASVTASRKKTIIYLHFSINKKKGLVVFMEREKVGEDWTRESVEGWCKGKMVKVNGDVNKLPGPRTKRLGVKVIAMEQIELVD